MTLLQPVGLPGLAAVWLGVLLFFVAMLVTRIRAGAEDRGNPTRSRRSVLGIVLQGIAVGVSGIGPIRIGLDPLGAPALSEALVVALLMGTATLLFLWSTRTMGRNWSVVARMRADHSLVTTGPFRWVRHPIYSAIALFMPALALATGHRWNLVPALPLFALGTWLRISVEERMLRGLFGAEYDRYAARVPRFVPGVF